MLAVVTTPQDLDAHFRQAVAELAGADPSPAPADVPQVAPDQRDAETQGDAETPDGAEVRESAAVEGGAESEETPAAPAVPAVPAVPPVPLTSARRPPGTPERRSPTTARTARSGRCATPPGRCGTAPPSPARWRWNSFDAQLASRHLDLAARWLRSFGEGYYTIGSSGHEGNAAVAAALRPTDPALLHYRSGGVLLRRAMRPAVAPEAGTPDRPDLPALTPPATCCAAVVGLGPGADRRRPAQGLRQPDLAIIPTTSTIASHLPRAVGVAFAIERLRRQSAAARRGRPRPSRPGRPTRSSSARSATRRSTTPARPPRSTPPAGATTPAYGCRCCWSARTTASGISVRSPEGWVAAMLRARPGLRYFAADGCDLAATYDAATEAAGWVRRQRRPAVLHLRTVRLMGHAGADAEVGLPARRRDRRPTWTATRCSATARLLVDAGLATPEELLARYDEIGWQVRRVAEEVHRRAEAGRGRRGRGPARPAPPGAGGPRGRRRRHPGRRARRGRPRRSAFGGKLPETGRPAHPGPDHQRHAHRRAARPTRHAGLRRGRGRQGRRVRRHQGAAGPVRRRPGLRHPARRDVDPRASRSAPGSAGLLPVPEIQYLAYLHNAEDQLRGEAATMRSSPPGAYRNPMVRAGRRAAPTRRASAGTSTTTTRWPCCATSPAWWSPCRRGRPTPRRCCAPAWPRPRSTAASASSWSRSRSTTPATCTPTATTSGWRRTRPPGDWAADHVPIGRARVYGVGPART